MLVSTTSKPMSRARVITVSRVIPGRIDEVSDGVWIFPSRTTKTFSPEPSETKPEASSAIASE